IALALVELISANVGEPAPPPPPPMVESSVSPSGLVLRVGPTGGGMWFSEAHKALAGGGLRVAGRHGSDVGWIVDAQGHHSRTWTGYYGAINTDLLAFGAAATMHAGRFDLGAGLRGGLVRMAGSSDSASMIVGGQLQSTWWGPMALIDGSIPL